MKSCGVGLSAILSAHSLGVIRDVSSRGSFTWTCTGVGGGFRSPFAVIQYRRRHSSVARAAADPHADEFMFIRLAVWPYILLGVAALFAGASWLGYPLLD
jgi:hypothetical protein